MNVWELSAKQVEDLQGGDGGAFRDFVNCTIRAHATACGISSAAISTDSRNMKDGGVDCQVSQGATNDPQNRLRNPTCWQYKATSHTSITEPILREEVQKNYCAALIKQGYAYRFCISDTLTSEKKTEWENVLKEEVKKLNPNAPEPQILTSTCLAQWGSQFPAIVAARIPVERFLHLEAWGRSIIQPTEKYVPVKIWEEIANLIKQHIDLSKSVTSLIIPVHADAGIGKTRLVYETLVQIPASKSVVLYTSDEESALNLAHFLATYSDRFAVLVVDECSQESRLKIQECLRGNEKRIRVITISNFVRTMPSAEPTLARMPNETVEQVLKMNFPHVPEERRRAAVSLAGGFIKIAADICQNDLAGGLWSAEQYYGLRIPDRESQKVIEAISLVKKVGFSGEVAKEFEDLCTLVGLNIENAKRLAKELKESPGFVAIGGRYFYITPEAIAQVALQNAWKHCVQDNPPNFFKRVPGSLLNAFQMRVAHSGSKEFRDSAAAYFKNWSSELKPEDLEDKKKIKQLVALIDTDPTRFLPILVRLVENATPEQLLSNKGYGGQEWGPRRDLVWLCERLSLFAEYFYDVEKILFRLAICESEKGIVNNATETWKQFFTIILSGSSIPYRDRLEIIKARLRSESLQESLLTLDALSGIFQTHASRVLGPAVVAGRIPPPDWHPKTNAQYFECYTNALALYEDIIAGDNKTLKSRALTTVIEHINWFLDRGFFNIIRDLLRPERVETNALPKILAEIDLFIRFHTNEKNENKVPRNLMSEIEEWRKSLVPNNFHAKLVSIVGRSSFDFYNEPGASQWKGWLNDLVNGFFDNPALLKQELPWLISEEAKSSGELGAEIGKRDKDATFFDLILLKGNVSNLGISRGYLFGLIESYPEQQNRANAFLDNLETSHPELAFDYASVQPQQTDAFTRWMRLYDANKIQARSLVGLFYRLSHGISVEHLKQVLPRFLKAISSSQLQADHAALHLIHHWIEQQKRNKSDIIKDPDLWDSIGKILEKSTPQQVMGTYYWREIMAVYSEINPPLATKIACALLDDDLSVEKEAEKILLQIAPHHPDLVMNGIGNALFNEKTGWKLLFRGIGSLIGAVPPHILMEWLDKTHVEGARKIAGGLPRPFLDEAGKPIVPLLTELTLKRFGDDEKVTQAFICGSGTRSYSGDIAGQRLREAGVAAKFLQHPIPAIREWARIEKLSSESEAAQWRQRFEETYISE